MTPEWYERFMQHIESRNRGWLHGGEVPRCRVFLDGRELQNVMSVHRAKGVLRVYHKPLKVDKHRKRVRTYTLYGAVRVEFF